MSIEINLPPQLETELTAEAKQLGLSLSDYALRLLAAGRAPLPVVRTGADLVRYWKDAGLIGTRPDIQDSAEHARELRQRAEQRTH